MLLHRLQHGRALRCVNFAARGQVGVEKTILDDFVRHHLRQRGRMQIGALLRLLKFLREGERRDHVAETNTGREYFRERPQVHHCIGTHRQ